MPEGTTKGITSIKTQKIHKRKCYLFRQRERQNICRVADRNIKTYCAENTRMYATKKARIWQKNVGRDHGVKYFNIFTRKTIWTWDTQENKILCQKKCENICQKEARIHIKKHMKEIARAKLWPEFSFNRTFRLISLGQKHRFHRFMLKATCQTWMSPTSDKPHQPRNAIKTKS